MIIDSKGRKWFKGNLHTHTTNSDGDMEPEKVIELYRSRGYDFMAMTEHWKYTPEAHIDDFLIVPGIEYDFGSDAAEGIFHIVCLGHSADLEGMHRRIPFSEDILTRVRALGGICEIAHPAWSLNTPAMLEALPRFDASEIFNSVSDQPFNCRPDSGLILDMLAAKGMPLPLLAVDDVHFYKESDACRSFIMVNVDELTTENVIAAIKNGNFYASQGPTIEAVRDGDTITVTTSPVDIITVYTDVPYIPDRCVVGDGITGRSYTFGSNVRFARFEARDSFGRRAWTNYIMN